MKEIITFAVGIVTGCFAAFAVLPTLSKELRIYCAVIAVGLFFLLIGMCLFYLQW